MGLQIGQGFNERPHVLAESLGVNGTLPSSYRGAGVFLGRVPLHKEECPQKVDQRRRFRHHLVDGEKIPPNQCNGCCTTKEGPKTAVFGTVGGKRLIREAVLDLLGEDVDVLNRWLALAGSLVRCLAEAGTCARRFVIVVFAGGGGSLLSPMVGGGGLSSSCWMDDGCIVDVVVVVVGVGGWWLVAVWEWCGHVGVSD